ncbi:MAG: Gfo/Idh/MocA family protein [Gemmatimonadota bacterium]
MSGSLLGAPSVAVATPRIGFLGVGWIGRSRMNAIRALPDVRIAAIAEPDPDARARAAADVPDAHCAASLDELLALDLDAIVIATPSALHVEQSLRALAAGAAVFCQKPLGRTTEENRAVIAAARQADRLLAVDLSYRHTAGMRWLREAVQGGELGDVFALDLVFHNAYGPGQPWYRDRALSGGGCVLDLGIHLVDLACWVLGTASAETVHSRLFHQGVPLHPDSAQVVEDYALADIRFDNGIAARLACSWHLHAGQDAVIEVTCHGTRGSAVFRNVNGSFFDFAAEHLRGTTRQTVVTAPDDWPGRAASSWAQQLTRSARYDADIESLEAVATILDRILGR